MTEGMKSTEFWLSIAALAAGVWLAHTGADLTTIVAVVAPPAGYSVSRGLAKGKR